MSVLARRFAVALLRAVNATVPKHRSAVIRTFPDLDDTTRSLTAELARHGVRTFVLVSSLPSIHPPWLPDSACVLRISTMRALWAYCRSSHVFFSHGVYGSPSPVRGQVVVNVWHGMPIKKIGRDIGQNWLPQFTFTIATSPRFAEIVARSFDTELSKVLLVGAPRNDLLSYAPAAGLPSRFVLWLPTFRRSVVGTPHSDGSSTQGLPKIDEVAGLVRQLKAAGYRLIVKPHPMADRSESLTFEAGGAEVVDEAWLASLGSTLYELVGASSALITDYSSVAVDYLVVGRPLLLVQADRSEYEHDRGLNFTEQELRNLGTALHSFAELGSELMAELAHPSAVPADAAELFYNVDRVGAASSLLERVGLVGRPR